jgi:hypothetical protein
MAARGDRIRTTLTRAVDGVVRTVFADQPGRMSRARRLKLCSARPTQPSAGQVDDALPLLPSLGVPVETDRVDLKINTGADQLLRHSTTMITEIIDGEQP